MTEVILYIFLGAFMLFGMIWSYYHILLIYYRHKIPIGSKWYFKKDPKGAYAIINSVQCITSKGGDFYINVYLTFYCIYAVKENKHSLDVESFLKLYKKQ